jgi:large subunit ribosomal protein L10
MPTQKKIDAVASLTQKADKASSIIFADYRTIKHKQLEKLRTSIKSVDGEFIVTKNKLLERALGERSAAVKDQLRESTATLFSFGDEILPLKELLKFFKTVGVGKAKGGLLGAKVLSEAEVNQLAKLPGRQELLGKLVGQMKSPLYGLHHALSWNMNKLVWALNAVKGTKTA